MKNGQDAVRPKWSLAIAGAWGYIGQRFLTAARELGLGLYAYDPQPAPDGLDLNSVEVVRDEAAFYRLPADVFHLALHPQHRAAGLGVLVDRALRGEPMVVLCEKPVALPEAPGACDEVLRASRAPGMKLFYDFPELFDPLTRRVHEYLGSFRDLRIREMWFQRSKDREAADNARNYKLMVPIQYQETVHCLAFALDLLERFGEDGPWKGGVAVRGVAEPYHPPNPEAYPYVVDGRCLGELTVGGVPVHLDTSFKRGAPYAKKRRIVGEGDGRHFVIEASYLEGRKGLRINGEDQGFPADSSSYAAVLSRLWAWQGGLSQAGLNEGLYPNVRLACSAYLLSSMLWEACHTGETLVASSPGEARGIADRYRTRTGGFPRYEAASESRA